ncbi:hypothetical protein TMatcc_008071 [Talaromyces marneffei ATCC 18224]|uniref:CBM1 domain-containing protein n=2 Tax=Talaromyces marneffei TaxID=37727 RepID=B6QEJ5_TALMQ|nr:uncharacterized protein EYB26_004970 [Talaromyces marneffei]EEA24969.1 conserved hypothetical protein [Talaromyces marneffei ATCC 18224]KAE8552563.1 hypothetical protein EYB25_003941 [Talaromyces marneffei]QGA17299.1 hypothetical protein EYB26_004970 [Talaromyces marneffei]
MKSYLTIFTLAGAAIAQVSAWGQCGGIDYTGSTTCASGYSCVFVNEWYSQCQPRGSATTSSPPSTTSSMPTSTGSLAAVRYLGRVNPATNELTWPGTGLSFTFTGSSAVIDFHEVNGTNSVGLIIDGGEPTVISNVDGTSISTPAGLSQGRHTVQLRKRSEALFGTIVVGKVTTDGPSSAEKTPPRKIEFIGDSITVGYGLDGTLPCTNTAALEDNPKTYAALAANALGADYSVVAWSGIGITRNYVSTAPDPSPIMPERYTRYGANDADNSYTFPSDWTPDAVVINLGTNDFGYLAYNASGQAYDAREPLNATTYTNAMVSFVQSIQKHYANAKFFLMTSPMLSDSFPTAEDAQHTTMSKALQAAISQIGANAHLVDWPTQGSEVGCDYHPNAATHAAQGVVLTSAISTVMGW